MLARNKECRKRNLTFHIPIAVSCSPNLRLLQNDSSYVTFMDIYEQHCDRIGIAREDPTLVPGEKVKTVLREYKQEKDRMVSRLLRAFCTMLTLTKANQNRVFHIEKGHP